MVVQKLVKITLLSPRDEISKVTTDLSKFEMFHVVRQGAGSPSDSYIDDLSLRALRVFLSLDEILKELDIKEVGLIEILTKGNKIEKENFKAKDWSDFISKIEIEAKPIIDEITSLITEKNNLLKIIEENESLKKVFNMLSGLSINLDDTNSLKKFRIVFSVLSIKDLKEVQKSLIDYVTISTTLTQDRSAILIATSADAANTLEKILRSFEIKPFEIPERLPQNIADAQNIVLKDLNNQKQRLEDITSLLNSILEKNTKKIFSLREGSKTVNDIFASIKKVGDLKRFALIRGYIPKRCITEFKKQFVNWIFFIEEVVHNGSENEVHSSATPTLMKNLPLVNAFETITLTQGPPKYSEVDPTPLIMFTFPIFYGIMFGDLGHGIILILFGLLLYIRGNNFMKKWGIMLTIAGLSASFVGWSIGEVFGFAIGEVIPSFGHPLLEIVERHHGVTSFNSEAVTSILQISIILGIFHLTIGFGLDVFKTLREKDYVASFTDKIPTFIMYISGIIFALAFLGAGNNFDGLFTMQNPIPLLGIPVAQASLISLPIFSIATMVLILGKPVAIILNKAPKDSLAMSFVMGLVEFIIRIVEFLANTMSYARLGVLLLVHAALLMVLNRAVSLPIYVAIPMLIVFNILVMMLEGLIVYIQDIRLHLYEWFTKFYEGTGFIFRKMKPEPTYFDVEWEEN